MAKVFSFTVESRGGLDLIDITPFVAEKVKGVNKGLALVFPRDPLCRLLTLEYEYRLVEDVKELVKGLKGSSHVKASVFSPSVIVPVERGGLVLGAFQQLVLIDFNEKGGAREVMVTVIEG